MKLDRNINLDGKGKYALVRLRGIEPGGEAHRLLIRLDELGHLDWGAVGGDSEFFVIKLKDQFAPDALKAYSEAASKQDPEWGSEVMLMAHRAEIHPGKKMPD